MVTRHLLDPQLLPLLDMLPQVSFTVGTVAAFRAAMEARLAEMPRDPSLPVPEIHRTPGRDGAPDVALHVYRPARRARAPRAAILHMHGGGMVLGSAALAAPTLGPLSEALDVVAVSVEYRLAPETAFPGPQEDCYAALEWLVREAAAFGVDPARIVVMGESAGGGLAAALAQMARDRGDYRLAGQVLVYPMLDHRTGGPEDVWRNPVAGEFVWTRDVNQTGWMCLRGDYGADDARKGWFSPALADDLRGLPPTYIMTGGLDLLADETLDYARRLSAAGVAVEAHLYPGAPHAFDMLPDAAVSRQAKRDIVAGLRRLLV